MKQSLIKMLIVYSSLAKGQLPVEMFGGHQKSTIDVIFFKYFKNSHGENSDLLFFNRNRASIDYRMTPQENLPQFGFTEAVSYNHVKLKGLAPVAVVQVFSWGVYPKAGFQYVRIKKRITLFGWVVCEILKHPDFDFFLLFRYTPKLTEKLNLFTQFETVNAFPTSSSGNVNLTQRVRLGLEIREWQFGVGADFNETASEIFTDTHNIGGFLRHEF